MLLANSLGFVAMGFYALLHYLLFNMVRVLPFISTHISWENINMETEKKKAPSKKELMRTIESLDKDKVFDLVSLNRTNIANIKAIANLLQG